MDPVDIVQLVFAGTTALVLGRMGLAVARRLERRLSGGSAPNREADERLRAVEDECAALREELGELQERQDYTERILHQDAARTRLARPDGTPPRVETPH